MRVGRCALRLRGECDCGSAVASRLLVVGAVAERADPVKPGDPRLGSCSDVRTLSFLARTLPCRNSKAIDPFLGFVPVLDINRRAGLAARREPRPIVIFSTGEQREGERERLVLRSVPFNLK